MKTLVVIDMQNDFINGSLGTSEAVSIVDNVVSKIAEYEKLEDNIIFTRDTHNNDYLLTAEGQNLPIVHCVKNTYGWEISSKINTDKYKIIDKPCFGSLELAEYLKQIKDLKEIELVGLCTDICVISNALILKAALPETTISVDSKCCAGVSVETHINALNAMKLCHIDIK